MLSMRIFMEGEGEQTDQPRGFPVCPIPLFFFFFFCSTNPIPVFWSLRFLSLSSFVDYTQPASWTFPCCHFLFFFFLIISAFMIDWVVEKPNSEGGSTLVGVAFACVSWLGGCLIVKRN